MSQIPRVSYIIEKIEPMVINFRIEDENITVRIFLIPIAVYSQDINNITPIVRVVMAVDTDKPRLGELCNPAKMVSHRAFIPSINEVNEGGTVIKVNEKKFLLKLKITNINVYTDLRDELGNPCVNISWILLTTAE